MPDDTVQIHARAADGGLRVTVEISLAAGGRLRQITVADGIDAVDLLATADRHDPSSTGWGSFPMAPWAGRLRHGRFRFLGRDVHLGLNHADGTGTGGGPIVPPEPAPVGPTGGEGLRRHAIHGTTFARRWDVVEMTETSIEMTCPLDGELGWPFSGLARQTISVSPRRVDLELSVESTGGAPFPAAVGWHPWFAKPDGLDFSPEAMYARDEIGLPTGELVVPPPPPWDDCFINHEPVNLRYDRAVASVVRITSSDCDHWVVYDKPTDATCVEPQSGPPDAPNLRPELATATHPVRRTMTLSW